MARAAQRSTFASFLTPLAGSLWIFFLILSVIVAGVWVFDIGEAQIQEAVRAREPQAALLWLVHLIDIVWVALAFVSVYLSLAQTVGLASARRWTVTVLICSWLIGALSVWTGWPVGKIHFTTRLGFLIGPVSIGWILLWCIIILGARDLVLFALPRASHAQVSLLTGVLAAFADFNMESVASRTRVWWLWANGTSHPNLVGALQNCLAWFLAATALAWSFRSPILSKPGAPRLSKGAVVFLVFQAILLLAHLANILR